ncbi:hypothetical protein [Rhodopirellula bahusiensis]|uniref:hypothetical protein n=1 Tax=Rhodopirellula bahusiensis TaxID=2014065 RepID=UPI001E55C4F5|nr:hypothetical protein [Rhodopirellula bahusiensis]
MAILNASPPERMGCAGESLARTSTADALSTGALTTGASDRTGYRSIGIRELEIEMDVGPFNGGTVTEKWRGDQSEEVPQFTQITSPVTAFPVDPDNIRPYQNPTNPYDLVRLTTQANKTHAHCSK